MLQRIFYKLFGRKLLKDKLAWRGRTYEVKEFPNWSVDLSGTAVDLRLTVKGDLHHSVEIQVLCGRSLVPLFKVTELHDQETSAFACRMKLSSGPKFLDFYVKSTSSSSFSYLGSRFIYGFNSPKSSQQIYADWIAKYDSLTDQDCAAIKTHIEQFKLKPLISVVVPVYNTPEHYLRASIESVRKQLYTNWELCIADDASTKPHVKRVLAEYEQADKRIRVVYRPENGHISASSNSAMEIAKGEFIALLDHDDLLPERALYEVAWEVNQHPQTDVIYTDEDIMDDEGKRHTPHFKTDFNVQLLYCQNMISHLGVYRRSLIEKIGGFRIGYEGSQDHDLALRAIAATTAENVRHIPLILYHWRQNGGESSFSNSFLEKCIENSRKAVRDSLQARGGAYANAAVSGSPVNRQFNRVQFPVPEPEPKVSIIVPFNDDSLIPELETCQSGLRWRSGYRNVEVLVTRDKPMDSLKFHPETKWAGPDIGSAVAQVTGEILLFIDPRVQVVQQGWMQEMVANVCVGDVGIVGPKLLAENGTVLSAGVVQGLLGNHYGRGADAESFGFFAHLVLQRNVSAVSGLCWAIRRAVYDEFGGLDLNLGSFDAQTLDLCLRVGKKMQIVWAPHAQLLVTRALKPALQNPQSTVPVTGEDPFYNPNLSLQPGIHGTVELAFPPRRKKSWAS